MNAQGELTGLGSAACLLLGLPARWHIPEMPLPRNPADRAHLAKRAFDGAVAHFQRDMMMDVDQAAKAMKDAEIEAEIEDFVEGFKQPTYRGMRVNGVRVPVWSSRNGWSGL